MLDDESRENAVTRGPIYGAGPSVGGPAMYFEAADPADDPSRIEIHGDPRVIGQRLAKAHAREQADMVRRRNRRP